MYFAKQDFFFGDRQFKTGDVVPDGIVSDRLKDLGIIGFKADEVKPKVESTKPKVESTKPKAETIKSKKKHKLDEILIDESSKVEVSKEI